MRNQNGQDFALVAGGIIIGVSLAGFVGALSSEFGLSQWIYKYQSLSAGILGLVAAALTALLILWQIRQNYHFNAEDRRRRLVAARSVMPLVLSELNEYARECFDTALQMARGTVESPILPPLNEKHIEALKECIEQASEKHQAELGAFVRLCQVQRARFVEAIQNYRRAGGPPIEQEEADTWIAFGSGGHLYSTCEMIMSVRELWEFVRPEEDLGELGKRADRIDNLFIFSNEFPEEWPKFIGHFKRTADKMKDKKLGAKPR